MRHPSLQAYSHFHWVPSSSSQNLSGRLAIYSSLSARVSSDDCSNNAEDVISGPSGPGAFGLHRAQASYHPHEHLLRPSARVLSILDTVAEFVLLALLWSAFGSRHHLFNQAIYCKTCMPWSMTLVFTKILSYAIPLRGNTPAAIACLPLFVLPGIILTSPTSPACLLWGSSLHRRHSL